MINSLRMIKQTANKLNTKSHSLTSLFFVAVLAIAFSISSIAKADQFDAQINSLRQENSGLQTERQSLQGEAESLEALVASLRAQIQELQAQINANQAKMTAIKASIAKNEAELAHQRSVLGQNIRAMYLEGDMSTVEMLASSRDLSDYLDKEQYRNSVQDKIQTTMDKIEALSKELEAQKTSVEKILADQKALQGQLSAQRAEQARLLALNESQRSSLSSEIRANSSKISQLRREQAAANARLFGNSVVNKVDGSGYPWPNVYFPNTLVDPWGMYKRQCVSYTAWKVAASGRHMPYWGGHGNANLWDDNARRAGIPVDRSPRVGDVAVSNSGFYGHVMYVEAVYGDGTIYISQYNAGWTGRYSEARISIGNLVFIHF